MTSDYPKSAITFEHIFQNFRLRTLFICAQKCISFAHSFSVTFARVFAPLPWPANNILLYEGTINKISALLPLLTDLRVEEFEQVHTVT